jgi:hypothetical protein
MVKVGGIVAILCATSVALAGCGGGGGGGGTSSSTTHTYVVAPHVGGSLGSKLAPLAKDLYLTLVSPVAIPTSLLTKGGNKIVSQAQGPQKCSVTKVAHATHGPGAFLNGKTVTFKVNGTSPFTAFICSALKKQPFNASKIAGG